MRPGFIRTFLILALVVPTIARADAAEEVWDAYLAGDFARVAQLVQSAISDTALEAGKKAHLYFTFGCSNAMQGNNAAAAEAFKLAFAMNPRLHYESLELPPPVWKIFKSIQDSVQSQQQINLKPIPETAAKTTRIDTVRIVEPLYHGRSTVIRSLAFPGWGHLHEGSRRGYKYIIGESILLASLAYSLQMTWEARDDYSRSRSAADVERYYARYNNRYRISWGLGASAVALYLFAQWDLFSHPPAITVRSSQSGALELGLHLPL